MRKRKNWCNRKVWIASVLCALFLCGCANTDSEETNADSGNTNVTTENMATTEVVMENSYSIQYKDWKVEESPVAGRDNLYALKVEELSGDGKSIFDVHSQGRYLLALVNENYERDTLYKIDPLEEKVVASYTFAGGNAFGDASIKVNEQGHIVVRDTMTGGLFLLDEDLELLQEIQVSDANGEELFLSQDEKYAYYVSGIDGYFYKYDVANHVSKRIFADVETGSDYHYIVGLVNEDSSLLYSYTLYEGEEYTDYVECRQIDNGELLLQSQRALYGSQVYGDQYMIKGSHNGVDEFLWGTFGEEHPKVFLPDSYLEVSCMEMDCRNQTVLTCRFDRTFQGYEYMFYDMKDASNPYRLTYYVDSYADSFCVNKMVYLEEADCCVLSVLEEPEALFVWDITKESSQSQVDETYYYSYQRTEEIDETVMKELKARAKEVEDKYGIGIVLDSEVANCPVSDFIVEPCCYAAHIEMALDELDRQLARYPKGMLSQIAKLYPEQDKLTIYLASRLQSFEEERDESGGLHNAMDNIIAFDIDDRNGYVNAIHHELYHAVETKVEFVIENVTNDEDWNVLNPEGFEYDSDYLANQDNADNGYTAAEDCENAYFVDTYGKSFSCEDRARIMEYTMWAGNDPLRNNVKSPYIKEKLRVMSDWIRQAFNTTGWPEQTEWEKVCELP